MEPFRNPGIGGGSSSLLELDGGVNSGSEWAVVSNGLLVTEQEDFSSSCT